MFMLVYDFSTHYFPFVHRNIYTYTNAHTHTHILKYKMNVEGRISMAYVFVLAKRHFIGTLFWRKDIDSSLQLHSSLMHTIIHAPMLSCEVHTHTYTTNTASAQHNKTIRPNFRFVRLTKQNVYVLKRVNKIFHIHEFTCQEVYEL